MSDFEVHPIGTSREIKLSRELAKSIDEAITQYGKVVPHDVLQAYLKLREFYAKQIETELL